MSTFSLVTSIQRVDTLPAALAITETATLAVPTAEQIVISAYLADADDFRKAEIYRGWQSLYRGWKSHAYDPFAAPTTTEFFTAPLSSPTIALRKISVANVIDVDVLEGEISFGYGENISDRRGENTLLARMAFERLLQYYLETRK